MLKLIFIGYLVVLYKLGLALSMEFLEKIDCDEDEEWKLKCIRKKNHYYDQYSYHSFCAFKRSSLIPSSIVGLNECNSIYLYLNSSNLTHLDPGSINMFNLYELYIQENNLTHISKGVFNILKNLKVLNVSKNNIQVIDQDSFKGINNLVTLDLSYNKLTNLSLSLQGVENLNVSHNNIVKLINESVNIASLRFLDLSFNELSEINLKLTDVINLTEINLSNNQIQVILPDFLCGINSIKILQLQNNKIRQIAPANFRYFSALKYLNLSKNALTKIDNGYLSGLQVLEILDLSNNLIQYVSSYEFYEVKRLKEIYLSGNKIAEIDDVLLKSLPSLEFISFENNNFSCNALINLISKLIDKNISIRHGNDYSTTNYLGIACRNRLELKIFQRKNNNETLNNLIISPSEDLLKLQRYFDTEFKKSGFYNFFSANYRITNFFKYFDSGFKTSYFYKYFNNEFLRSPFFMFFEKNHINQTLHKFLLTNISEFVNESKSNSVQSEELYSLINDIFQLLSSTPENSPLLTGNEKLLRDLNEKVSTITTLLTITLLLLLLAVLLFIFELYTKILKSQLTLKRNRINQCNESSNIELL